MAEALGIAASIIALVQITGKVATLTYRYMGAVKQSPKDLQDLVDELRSLDQVLAGLQGYILTSPATQSIAGPLDQCAGELKRLQTRLEKKKSLRGLFSRLKWPLEETETYQIIGRIERHKSSLTLSISSNHFLLSQEIHEVVQKTSSVVQTFQSESVSLSQEIKNSADDTTVAIHDISTQVGSTNTAVQGLQTVMDSEKHKHETRIAELERREVLEWLYPGETDKRHMAICSKRQKDSGIWFLRSDPFIKWSEEGIDSLLWGYGIPGAGKTFITSTVIDYLHVKAKAEGFGVAYIYFDFNEQDKQMPIDILATLVKQLTCQHDQLPAVIKRMHSELQRRGSRPNLDELFDALLEIIQSFPRVYLVFDALDECHEENQRRQLLPLFNRMVDNGIRIFITSRQHPEDIQRGLGDGPSIRISADEDDLKNYIISKIRENPRAKNLVHLAKCRDRIVAQLVECAQGMFLLVRLHLEHLCQQTTPKQVLKELDRLYESSMGERSLGRTYDRIIERIKNQPQNCVDLATKVLSYLQRARRTLTLDELITAVAVEPNRYELDSLDLPAAETLLDVCAGLVVIDGGVYIATIRLAHYSVQEYLQSSFIDTKTAEFQLATTCITYLSFDGFAQGRCEDDLSLVERFSQHPLLDYAVHNFQSHLQACDEDLSFDLVIRFLENQGSIDSYAQAKDYMKELNTLCRELDGFTQFDHYPKNQLPLHVASSVGHLLAVRHLLKMGADVLAQDSNGMAPLHRAVEGAHDAVVELLLQNGADPLVKNDEQKNAFDLACAGGQAAVVRLLIQYQDSFSVSQYLGAASSKGDLSMVQTLLKLGVCSGPEGHDLRQEAIFRATAGGHDTVVGALLAGVECPLHLKQYGGLWGKIPGQNDDLTESYQVPSPYRSILYADGQNALHVAASQGYLSIFLQLIEKEVDITVTDDLGQSALHLAATWENNPGAAPILSILRETGNHWKINDAPPLLKQEEIALLLVKNGADYSSPDNLGQYILHRAAQSGYEKLVKLLLSEGVDPLLKDNNGRTALHRAAMYGSKGTLEVLIKADPKAAARDNAGQTPLHVASCEGNPHVVEALLQFGAGVDLLDNNQKTPLQQVAAQLLKFPKPSDMETPPIDYGFQIVSQLLIAGGADFSFATQGGRNILHCAAAGGYSRLVQWLLDIGVDSMTRDGHGKTVLQIAATGGIPWVLGMLVGFWRSGAVEIAETEMYLDVKSEISFVAAKVKELREAYDKSFHKDFNICRESALGLRRYSPVLAFLESIVEWYEEEMHNKTT